MVTKMGNVFCKLMNNVYGKAMEKVRNRIDVKLVSNKKDYLKWTSKPSYISCKIFDNDLIAKRKITLTLNKPTNIRICILELSIYVQISLWYSKNKYDNNSRLLFTDTDSSMYEMPEMKTEDAYEDFSYEKEMFYFSNYSTNSKYYNSSNKLAKKVLRLKNLSE